MVELEVVGAQPVQLEMDIGSTVEWSGEEYVQVRYSELPEYDGATEWTPEPYAQTIPTEGYAMRSDIIINPIPSNYGLITWNGSTLTVS